MGYSHYRGLAGRGVLAVLLLIWRQLFAATVSPELAEAEGMKAKRANFIFMVLMAIVIAISMKIVGVLLITAMLIIPAATARRFASGPEQMALLAAGFGVVSVGLGLGASRLWDPQSGPAIVVAALGLFLVKFVAACRKTGPPQTIRRSVMMSVHHHDTGMTRNQSLVLGQLSRADGPLSAYTILDQLRGDGFRAPLQVYRALEKLIADGHVHRLESLNAFVACSQANCCDTHATVAFAICEKCGHVAEISDSDLDSRLNELAGKSGFQLKTSVVELRGLCAERDAA